MKITKTFLLNIVVVLCFTGCASTRVTMLSGNVYPARSAVANVDVYMTNRPAHEYIEIAQIVSKYRNDDNNLLELRTKARELGADAVIVIGKAGTSGGGFTMPNSNYVSTSSVAYGMTAVAIKYKDTIN